MKKIAIIFIAFSVTLYGCIFDIGFDKDQHRVNVPVLVSNLKDTLNIGDTLIFSAAISNPVEVTDLSRQRKKTFEGTLSGSLGFVIGLTQFSENSTVIGDVVPFQDRPSTFNFIAEKGFFPRTPPSIDFEFDSGKFSFKFIAVLLKKGLYGLRLDKEFTTIKNNNNKLEGHIYPYFSNKELNHKLT
ncbi:hypothetical protein, partial [Runella limosa]|uniref:hypothetical protein n=1 Tax=Runella limosa TaxID=370978 RepID=UPI00056D2F80